MNYSVAEKYMKPGTRVPTRSKSQNQKENQKKIVLAQEAFPVNGSWKLEWDWLPGPVRSLARLETDLAYCCTDLFPVDAIAQVTYLSFFQTHLNV
jgi:hypothetical protein